MKSKKILTILLSLAIMFTFMPAMAFADTVAGTWSNQYSEVKVGNETYTNITKSFSDGFVHANINTYDTQGIYPTIDDAVYVDMQGAALNFPGTLPKNIFEGYFNNEFKELQNPGFILTIPSYVSNYNSFATKTYNLTATNGKIGNWYVTVKLPKDYDPAATEDQKVTLEAKVESYSTPSATAGDPDVINNTVITKEVTVKAPTTAKTGADVSFFLDEVSDKAADVIDNGAEADHNENYVAVPYDGKAHTIVSNTVKDVNVAWGVWNTTTAKYDSVAECPSVTNYGDDVEVLATVTWTTTETSGNTTTTVTHKAEVPFNLYISAGHFSNNLVKRIYFNFNKDGDAGDFAYKVAEGTEYNAADFVVPEYAKWVATTTADKTTWRWDTSYDEKKDAAAKATVAANQALLKEFFNEFFEIKASSTAADPNTVTLIMRSNLAEKMAAMKTVAEKNAFKDKYGQLIKNIFGLSDPFVTFPKGTDHAGEYPLAVYGMTVGNGTATVNIIPATPVVNDKDDDISFSGQTKFVYKGKKTTKKGVLKAKKTITVNAVADSGNALTFVATKTAGGKITVSKAGKITVKKGLKKGTYKVTVKAKTAAGNGYKAASEKQTYTIVVKK